MAHRPSSIRGAAPGRLRGSVTMGIRCDMRLFTPPSAGKGGTGGKAGGSGPTARGAAPPSTVAESPLRRLER